jgi:hypothetical protein
MNLPPVGDLAEWAVVGVSLLNALGTVVMLRMRAEFASKDSLGTHAARVDDLGLKIGTVSVRVDTLARRQGEQPDVHELSRQITRLHGNVETLEAKIGALNDTIERIERPLEMLLEHQLKSGK